MASQDIAKMTQSEVFDQKGVAYRFFYVAADRCGQSAVGGQTLMGPLRQSCVVPWRQKTRQYRQQYAWQDQYAACGEQTFRGENWRPVVKQSPACPGNFLRRSPRCSAASTPQAGRGIGSW